MTTQRDELAREIHSTEQLGCGCCTDYNYTREQDQHADKLGVNPIAVAIGDTLLAAGWIKPRTDITVEWGTGEGTEVMRWRDRGQAERQSASATKSSDGGKTWQHTNPPIVSRIVTEWEPTA